MTCEECEMWLNGPTQWEERWPDMAVYCEVCEMWLNGPTQWEDHKIGKKHNVCLKKWSLGGKSQSSK